MILADSAAVTYGSSGGWWMQDAVISKPINHASLPGRWVELGVFAFLVRLGERTHDYLRFEIFLEGAGGFKNEDQDKD